MPTKVINPRISEKLFDLIKEVASFFSCSLGKAASLALDDYFLGDNEMVKFWDNKFCPPPEPPKPPPKPEELAFYSQKGLLAPRPIDAEWLRGQVEKRESNGQ